MQPLFAPGSAPPEGPSREEIPSVSDSPGKPLEPLLADGSVRRIPWRKTVALASVLGMTLATAGCSDDPPPPPDDGQVSAAQEAFYEEAEDVDDNDLFVYSGGHYYPYRSFNGPMAGNTIVRKDNGTYVPYTGSKHPPSWTANPGYVKPATSASKPTTSSGVGTVTRKSNGGSGSSFGSSGSSASFGSSSSGARSGSSSSGG
ncbi:hypothetical protein [Heliomicrobium modesticaldum]|nr:hypothetical protein [Heliomicrobium modesticaldum]